MGKAILIIICIVVSGCSASRKLGDEYLKADQLESGTFGEAMQELKYDYLNMRQPVITETRKTEILSIAKQALLTSISKQDYSEIDYDIDETPRMPETFAYYFIHFLPNKDKPKITHTTYLVVIDRFNNRVVYHDIYIQPKGDAFYKYYEILSSIRGR